MRVLTLAALVLCAAPVAGLEVTGTIARVHGDAIWLEDATLCGESVKRLRLACETCGKVRPGYAVAAEVRVESRRKGRLSLRVKKILSAEAEPEPFVDLLTPTGLETDYGTLQTLGCTAEMRERILGRVAEFYGERWGYGGTEIARERVDGLLVECGNPCFDPQGRPTCCPRSATRVTCARSDVYGVAHELGHVIALRNGRPDWRTIHHAGGSCLLGHRCTHHGAGPQQCHPDRARDRMNE